MKRNKYHLFASMLALGTAMPAFAQAPAPAPAPQAAPQAADKDAKASDVVVVTANKREESVQDIAVAVTAIKVERRRSESGEYQPTLNIDAETAPYIRAAHCL